MEIDNIYVLDAETSLHNDEVGKFKAHPMSPNNWIVWLGGMKLDPKTLEPQSMPGLMKFPTRSQCNVTTNFDVTKALVVGHNIGFDLLYMCNKTNQGHQQWRDFINNPDTIIWDTQIAAYRLSGQSMISPSLDKCCEVRGWPLKPGKLKEYWALGISTEDIPDDEVRPYLEHDVSSTARLFKAQIIEAQELGMLEMLQIEMRSKLTTLVMEFNGMCFDQTQARLDCEAVLRPLREKAEEAAIVKGMALFGLPREAVKPASPHFLKAVLYGGLVKWKEQLPVVDATGEAVYFKTGKRKGELKTKWYDFEEIVAQGMSPMDMKITDDDTLAKIIDHRGCSAGLADFLEDVRTFRDGQKQEKTYFTGYSNLTWPDGMIHGNLNHCITATGRLSSTNPNTQNAGHSPIRTHFTSRYKGGSLMEVDLSQIEVVAQAFLSQDKHMIQDIIDGVDFHTKRAAFAHGVSYQLIMDILDDKTHPEFDKWTKIRKGAKIVSFQKAYGAGPKKIADTTGLTMAEVKLFMRTEDDNYPSVPVTQEAWIAEVNRSTMIRDGRVCGILTSPINVQYRFFQDDFNGHKQYKPTCIKNYEIQGFSADLLKMILAPLRSVVRDYNMQQLGPTAQQQPILIVNTVHDSVIFDLPSWVDVKHLGRILRDHFQEAPISVLKNMFGVDFNAPIRADVDVGKTWHDMKTIDL